MKCSLCQRALGELSGGWHYCHYCNIQVWVRKSKTVVYDIDEDGDLNINRMKTYVFQKHFNHDKYGVY